MNLTRRHFVGFGTLLSAGASLGFVGLRTRGKAHAQGFPTLVPDPQNIIDLPAGFTYKILQKAGDAQSDGSKVRAAVDGMAAFAGDPGQVILMRNHELAAPSGGVSRVVVDLATLAVVSSNDVLTGTDRNCAGGPSPWGWLTCEEVAGGRVWLCPLDATSVLTGNKRRAIDAYGMFKHEAVCIDPDGLVAYLTEDDGDSHLYRMVPSDPAADPFAGKLQALKVVGSDSFDTSKMAIDDSVEVEWVDVNPATARADAKTKKAALVWRGEGIWWFDGMIYITATSNNQVFELVPSTTGGTLRLVAKDFKGPDNITVAPWGDLYVAEDHSGVCRIRIIDATGNVSDFAQNALAAGQEFAGVCFSPDGKVLFVNMQWSGHTLAITGPFQGGDSMPTQDGGTDVDGGSHEDAGGPTDAGAPVDGGGSQDGGSSGPRDGGMNGSSDAGDKGDSKDAGGRGDAGNEPPADPGGCAVGAPTKLNAPVLVAGVLGATLAWRRSRFKTEKPANDA